ncbi:MAG TPA: hypothetical protein VHS59_13095, partial [Bacillota bacterium]|nr:hypothetical protein [Bacillota bacterium]
MSLNERIYLIAGAVLLGADFLMLGWLLLRKVGGKIRTGADKSGELLLAALLGQFSDTYRQVAASQYFGLKQTIQLDNPKKANLGKLIGSDGLEKRQIKRLRSSIRWRRIEAAVELGLLATDNARLALEQAISRERNYPARLYMANALADIGCRESIPVLVASLLNAHRWYRERVNMLVADFGENFHAYLPQILASNSMEIKELIVDFSSLYFSETLKDYLISLIDNKAAAIREMQVFDTATAGKCCGNCAQGTRVIEEGKRQCSFKGLVSATYQCRRYRVLPVGVNTVVNYNSLVKRAADILGTYYPKVLVEGRYLNSEDVEMRNSAIQALAKVGTLENLHKLVSYLKNDDTERGAINAISRVIENHPEYLITIVKMFDAEKDTAGRKRLAEILAGRIEYFIMKLGTKHAEPAARVIEQVLLLGRTSEVIDFLNKNRDIDLENELVALIKKIIPQSLAIEKDFCRYLSERLANKCGIKCSIDTPRKKETPRNRKLKGILYALLFSSIMMFPAVYAVRHYDLLFRLPLSEQLKIFVVDFNYYLAFYSAAINLIYFGLLILSYFQLNKQSRMWRIKNISLLFK